MAGPGTYNNLNRNNAIRYSVPTTGDLPPTSTDYQLVLIEATAEVYYFDPSDNTWKQIAAGAVGPIDINSGTTGTLDLDRGGTGVTSFAPDEIIAANSAADALESTGVTTTELVDAIADIATLQADVDGLESDVSDLEADVTALQGDVGALEAAVTAIEADITTIEGQITDLQQDVNDLDNDKVDKVPMTNDTLVRADGVDGDIKGSTVTLDDDGDMGAVKSISTVGGSGSFFLIPNLTGAQRDALTPSAGMMIFNTESSRFEGYFDGGSGLAWGPLHGWGS